MSFTVFTDGCSNLPGHLLASLDIQVLPCSYVLDGIPGTYEGDIDSFDTHAYYNKLRSGSSTDRFSFSHSFCSPQDQTSL